MSSSNVESPHSWKHWNRLKRGIGRYIYIYACVCYWFFLNEKPCSRFAFHGSNSRMRTVSVRGIAKDELWLWSSKKRPQNGLSAKRQEQLLHLSVISLRLNYRPVSKLKLRNGLLWHWNKTFVTLFKLTILEVKTGWDQNVRMTGKTKQLEKIRWIICILEIPRLSRNSLVNRWTRQR